MRIADPVHLSHTQRRTLTRWRRCATHPRRARRAAIVLLAARGWSNDRIAVELDTDAHTVARWRRRFAILGLAGIATERHRTGRPASSASKWEREILRLSARPSQGGGRWSTRTLAAHLGISHMLVSRVWKLAGLATPEQ